MCLKYTLISKLTAWYERFFQDSDWEEVQTDGIENDREFLYSVSTSTSGKPTYEHLEAMAEVFNKVLLSYSCCHLYLNFFITQFYLVSF